MNYALFIITFASVSFLPGLCMSLALSLGISIGFKRSLPFMFGELLGVLLVIVVCGYGASIILQFKFAFYALQFFGSLFLFYTAFLLFRQKMSFKDEKMSHKDEFALLAQGFLVSVSNPKAWVFMLALLPPFLAKSNLLTLSAIILFIELCALCTYTLGGSAFRLFLQAHIDKLAKFSAFCVALLGVFMLYELVMQIQA